MEGDVIFYFNHKLFVRASALCCFRAQQQFGQVCEGQCDVWMVVVAKEPTTLTTLPNEHFLISALTPH